MLKVTDEWLIVCWGVYTVLALAATTNQRRPSLPMTYRNSKLSYGLYRSACTDISPGNFHLYGTVAKDIGPSLGYISLSASDVSGLIYVDRMVMHSITQTTNGCNPMNIPSDLTDPMIDGRLLTMRSECNDDSQNQSDFEEQIAYTILRVTDETQCHYRHTQRYTHTATHSYTHRHTHYKSL